MRHTVNMCHRMSLMRERWETQIAEGERAFPFSLFLNRPLGVSIYDVRTEEERIKKCSKFADKQFRFCGQRGGRGQKSRNSVDVIYESPLSSRPFVRFGESAARMVIATNTLYCGVAFWCHDEL